MSLSTIARRKLLVRSSLARRSSTFTSSSSSPSPPSTSSPSTPASEPATPPAQLPPEKMRALISLYHQSKDFISPANLSDKIDEVFAKDFYTNGTSFVGYYNLVGAMRERNVAPIVGDPRTNEQIESRRWTPIPAARREQMVVDALYGVDEDMPGLETLLEEEARVREAGKEGLGYTKSSV